MDRYFQIKPIIWNISKELDLSWKIDKIKVFLLLNFECYKYLKWNIAMTWLIMVMNECTLFHMDEQSNRECNHLREKVKS